VIALIGVGIAISQQRTVDLLIVGAIFVVGAVYYALFLRPRRSTHWRDPDEVTARARTGDGQARL